MSYRFWRALAAATAAVLVLTTQSAASGIVPHRAIYDLTMQRADDGANAVQMSGRMVIELSETCDSFLLNQRMLTRVDDRDGRQRLNDFRVAALEGKRGLRFRFTIENYLNGELAEVEAGRARMSSPGGSGVAVYEKPESRSVNLPAGTVFPVGSNIRILEAAIAGERSLRDTLFDGSGDGLYLATSYIGKRSTAGSPEARKMPVLRDLATWQVQSAFFSLAEEKDVPEFETHFRLFENGVSGNMTLDYGDVVLAAELVDLAIVERPDCN